MRVHELRTRLAIPTPLTDSHLSFYWPKGAPWREHRRFTAKILPPGSVQCSVDGCDGVFPHKAALEAHLKVKHGKKKAASFFQFSGACVVVPPFAAPAAADLDYCEFHLQPIARSDQIRPLK